MQQWHSLSAEDVLKIQNSSLGGLDESEARDRLIASGPNSLPEKKAPSLVSIFLNQFRSPLIYILLGAALLLIYTGDATDAYIIFAVLLFNAIVGAIQEGKAENTLLALKKYVETSATVVRGEREFIIPDRGIVAGDVIILQEGEKIPADARVIEVTNLKIDESSMTGESTPVHKVADPIEAGELPTSEQKNMVFKGTTIVSGHGRAVVVATGISTVIGTIAEEIAGIESEIPLKANIRYLSRAIIAAVAVMSGLIFAFGVWKGYAAKEMFMTVVSLSVSVIPEGLPIVITLVLATGVWRMSKQNALVKKLQAVEALGQARVIAVDKTGTLTKNEMVVRKIWTAGKMFEIGGTGYEPKGEIKMGGRGVEVRDFPQLMDMGRVATFCASARVSYSREEARYRVSGDPTEAALLVVGEKLGFPKGELEQEHPLIAEIAFDYKLKFHATAHAVGKRNFLTVVGAPEAVLPLCKGYERMKAGLDDLLKSMFGDGLRVLAVATNSDARLPLDAGQLGSLTFAGFFAIQDTLRPEVPEAMRRALGAGIRVVMITGDHKLTAQAIAKEAGIYREGDYVLTGEDIEHMTGPQLAQMIDKVTVFARVTPEHKLEIVNAYKKKGVIVAMTGDGVNDAPSLVAADLGVAMGKIGTEVAKEAADIVLLDDDFGSIVSAVEEGRSIYKTIKKVILYLFSTSAGEVLTITGALLLGLPLPLLAVQIIWLNFVTDGFLTVALGMEPKEEGLLSGKFEKPNRFIIDSLSVRRMAYMAVPMMLGSLYLFAGNIDADLTRAWTISLTTLAVFQWFNAWNCRSEDKSIFQMNPLSNKFLIAATAVVVGLQILAVYNSLFQKLLHTAPLSLADWLVIIPVALSIVVVEEARKLWARRGALTKPERRFILEPNSLRS